MSSLNSTSPEHILFMISLYKNTILTEATQKFHSSKIELSITNIDIEEPIFIMNIYIAPFEPISIIIKTIRTTTHNKYIKIAYF